MARELALLSATELSLLLSARQVSPVELVEDVLYHIDHHNSSLHSYITICADEAKSAALQAGQEIREGRLRGPLHGIPVAHKDVSWTAGLRTTAHSQTLLTFVPDEDATHVSRLRQAGTILVGKTNTTEFACGGLEIFGYTRNPWDLSRYTGGSSCGSANAVAAGLTVLATGSDTGGSIRAPSALCGIVGVKPTYGRVSRHGLIPLSWSMDTVGPMARCVADAALMLNAMAGYDPRDRASSQSPVPDYALALKGDLRGVTLGIPERHFYEGLDPNVDRAVRAALRQLEDLGARLEPVGLPRAAEMLDVGNVIIFSDAFALHAGRLRRQSLEYSERARRRIAAGAFYTAAEYQQATQLRALWVQEVDEVLRRFDALVTPTVKFPAFPIELQQAGGQPDTGLNTRPFNVSGHPAITVPCGFTPTGLPVGLQLIARPYEEQVLFTIGHAYERAAMWHRRRPVMEVAD